MPSETADFPQKRLHGDLYIQQSVLPDFSPMMRAVGLVLLSCGRLKERRFVVLMAQQE